MTSMSRTQRLSRLASAVVEAATGSRKGGWTKAAASGASHAVHSGKASVKKADSSTAPPPGQGRKMQSSRAGQGFTQPGLHSAMPAPRHAPHPGLLHSSPVTQASVPQDAAPEEPAQQLQPQLDIDPVVLVVKHFLESNGFKNSAKALEHEARKELEKVDDLDVSETNLVQILEEYAFLKQVEERRQKLIEENPLGADMMMLLDMHMGLPTPADGA
ncbi:unnamed protein product, partial [Ostreobium quekettii]